MFFKTRFNHESDRNRRYRRGVVMSELQTPCCPLVSQMILPDPLTLDHISKIQKKPFICLSYSSILPCLPMLEEYENKQPPDSNHKPFVDYEGAFTLLSFTNLLEDTSKIEYSNFVFYSNSNKQVFNEAAAARIIELIKPTMSIIPCEVLNMVDIGHWSTRKRTRMNDRYESYYLKLAESCNQTNLIAAKHPALKPEFETSFQGLDFKGFGCGESLQERTEHIRNMLDSTEKDQLRIIHLKTGTPLEIIHAVLIGIDIVVTPFSESASREGKALCFNIPQNTETDLGIDDVLELINEHCKFSDGMYRDAISTTIDLKDSVYKGQVDELLHESSNMKESRAYVNHLLDSKEMSAYIVLSSHNLHMYEALLQKIRDSIENNTLVGFAHNFIKSNVK